MEIKQITRNKQGLYVDDNGIWHYLNYELLKFWGFEIATVFKPSSISTVNGDIPYDEYVKQEICNCYINQKKYSDYHSFNDIALTMTYDGMGNGIRRIWRCYRINKELGHTLYYGKLNQDEDLDYMLKNCVIFTENQNI